MLAELTGGHRVKEGNRMGKVPSTIGSNGQFESTLRKLQESSIHYEITARCVPMLDKRIIAKNES